MPLPNIIDPHGETAGAERQRLECLRRYGLDGTPGEPDLDRIVRLGAEMFGVPICAITLVGRDQVWLRARFGVEIDSLQREGSFCAEVVRGTDPMVVPDALADQRFATTDLVAGAGIRFYAGAPLITRDGVALGSFGLLDVKPRHDFSEGQQSLLSRMAGIVVDLFERRHASRTANTLIAFADVAHQALITTDEEGRITFWNHGAQAMFGYEAREVEGRFVELIVPERFRAAHREGLMRIAGGAQARMTGRPLEVLAVRRDGSEFPAELSLSVWNGSLGLGFGAQLQDISDRRAREERLHHLANHDELTGLLNRNSFRARIEAQLESTAAATVMVFDLDGFKDVNDGLGHAAGDTLLQALALRLAASLGPDDVLARLGGDEFAILMPNDRDPLDIAARADALLDLIGRPFSVCGHQFHLSGSVGVALAPFHASNADELVVRADLALFRAKNAGGRRYRLFDTGMESQLATNRAFQDELRYAFTDRQLELHFQPQVSLADGRLIGAEALLRWRHPTRGLLYPKAFLPVLETHALAFEAGCWVLDEACRTLAAWRHAGLAPIRIGVNLFAAQLRAGTLVDVIESTLARHRLSPADLEVEITETIALRHDIEELEPLRELHARGVSIAFDDFGTGFASLSTLKDFPLSRLKLDRSFVEDIGLDPHSEAIVKGVVAIGHSLGLNVIAEGIETAEQEALLRTWRCDAGQGYHYGKAVPAAEFIATFGTPFSLAAGLVAKIG
ncbi:MAG: EAL domain-containing protein [Pseudomonadota bacterium]|uniref:Diguanylate cyclase/phosphodiesterase (GGDEF & EAL domains) with PAS/PAC sensor(S) n=1 Tax=hydrothermal vent metagenome TaxID=652676 RepID=A0A161KF09_9ZZZZ